MRYTLIVCGSALMMTGVPASAQNNPNALSVGAAPVLRISPGLGLTWDTWQSPELVEQDYRYRLVQLRKTALQQKAADGGVLTSDSITRLQARLDKLNMAREQSLRRLKRS